MNEKEDRKTAETYLGNAARIVGTERGQQHGELEGSFQMIADFWTTFLVNTNKVRYGNDVMIVIKPSDVLQMMSMMKKARQVWGDITNGDNIVDDLGYTALAGVLVANEVGKGDPSLDKEMEKGLSTALNMPAVATRPNKAVTDYEDKQRASKTAPMVDPFQGQKS